MRKFLAGIIFIAAALTTVGWGSTYDNNHDSDHPADRDRGKQHADRTHQGNDEDVKRAQGDSGGVRDIRDNKSHQDEEKDRT